MRNGNEFRLYDTLISAGLPIDSLTGSPPNIVIVYKASATNAQKTQGQTILSSFDWSDAAYDTWLSNKNSKFAEDELVDKNPIDKVVRALMLVILDEINLIRSKLSPALAARTAANIKTAMVNKLRDGSAD